MATYVTKTHLENFTEKLLVNDKKIRDELKQEISNLPSGGGSGSSYTLPTASTTTLGGVKVDGTTVTINPDGVISATASGSGSYTLPKATDTTLGGVKVDNDTITVDSEGVISATQELPIGGTTGQMLVKKSGTNYDVEWKDVPQGGADVDVATTDKAGIVKPDGTSITVDSDGTIHATTDTEQIKQDIEDYMTKHPGGFSSMTNEELTEMYNNIYDSIFNSGSSNVSVSSVSISGDDSLNVNNSTELTATILPSNATNKEVTWSIDSDTYATITPNGNKCTVTAKATTGTATVTVTTSDGNKTANKTISITNDADVDHTLSGKRVTATKYNYNQSYLTLYISTEGLSNGDTVTVTGGLSNTQNIKDISNNVTAYSATSKVVSENQGLSTQVSSKLKPSGPLSNFVMTGTLNTNVSNFSYIRVPVTINPLDPKVAISYTINSLTVAVNGVKKDIVAYGNLLAGENITIE